MNLRIRLGLLLMFAGLVLLALGLFFPANAVVQTIGYTNQTPLADTSSWSPSNGDTGAPTGYGQAFKVSLSGTMTSVSFYEADFTPDQFVILSFVSGTPTSVSFSCGTGGSLTCYQNGNGEQWHVEYIQTLTSQLGQTYNTVTLTTPFTVTANNWYAVVFQRVQASALHVIKVCGTPCGSTEGQPSTFMGVYFKFGTINPSGNYANTAPDPFSTSLFVAATFNLTPAETPIPTALTTALGGGVFGGLMTWIIFFGFAGGLFLYMTAQRNDAGDVVGFMFPMEVLVLIGLAILIGIYGLGLVPLWIPVVVTVLVMYMFLSRRSQGGSL